jgi:putative phage-type endonuclease
MQSYAPENFNGAKLLGVFESGTPEWHEVRADGIGGSEVGTVLGLNQWESPYYLWATKTGKLPPKQLDSFPAWLGTNLEPFILGPMMQHLHPDWELFTTGTYQHPTLPFLHANPDALAKIEGEWVIVEAKTSRNYWSEVPPSYVSQVMHYMNILGVKKAVIVGLVAMDPVEYWIDFDEFEAKVIEQKASEFWDMVVNDIAPDFDGAESTYEAVRQMHSEIDGTEIEIDGLHYLALAQRAADKAEADLRKHKSEVLAMMGNAQHAYTEHEGKRYRVATRQARGTGKPFLIVHKGNK